MSRHVLSLFLLAALACSPGANAGTGRADVDADRDGDGFSPAAGDCDDEDASVFPGARELPYDGVDQDCADGDLGDLDRDGHAAAAVGAAATPGLELAAWTGVTPGAPLGELGYPRGTGLRLAMLAGDGPSRVLDLRAQAAGLTAGQLAARPGQALLVWYSEDDRLEGMLVALAP